MIQVQMADDVHMNGVNGVTKVNQISKDIVLPPDLEASMLEQFDDLVSKKQVIWAPYFSEPVEDQGFKAVFELAPHLDSKPILPPDAPERKFGKGSNPFENPDPNFIACYVGPSHTLLQNKYCVYRPSLILHTNHFVPQSDDLDESDLRAAWASIKHFKAPYMMIYNCGIDSGSSQGHKHMQLWPYPDPKRIGFELFPSRAKSTSDITDDISNVPHQHFVLRFKPDADAEDVLVAYGRLLKKVQECHRQYGSTAYNVAMTKDWLCLIPRRDCGVSRGAGSNAAGVLGLIWILYDEEKEIWLEPNLCDYIQFLGIPRNVSSMS